MYNLCVQNWYPDLKGLILLLLFDVYVLVHDITEGHDCFYQEKWLYHPEEIRQIKQRKGFLRK